MDLLKAEFLLFFCEANVSTLRRMFSRIPRAVLSASIPAMGRSSIPAATAFTYTASHTLKTDLHRSCTAFAGVSTVPQDRQLAACSRAFSSATKPADDGDFYAFGFALFRLF